MQTKTLPKCKSWRYFTGKREIFSNTKGNGLEESQIKQRKSSEKHSKHLRQVNNSKCDTIFTWNVLFDVCWTGLLLLTGFWLSIPIINICLTGLHRRDFTSLHVFPFTHSKFKVNSRSYQWKAEEVHAEQREASRCASESQMVLRSAADRQPEPERHNSSEWALPGWPAGFTD